MEVRFYHQRQNHVLENLKGEYPNPSHDFFFCNPDNLVDECVLHYERLPQEITHNMFKGETTKSEKFSRILNFLLGNLKNLWNPESEAI